MKLEECCIVKDKSEFRIQKWNVMELKIIENKYNVEKKKKKKNGCITAETFYYFTLTNMFLVQIINLILAQGSNTS